MTTLARMWVDVAGYVKVALRPSPNNTQWMGPGPLHVEFARWIGPWYHVATGELYVVDVTAQPSAAASKALPR